MINDNISSLSSSNEKLPDLYKRMPACSLVRQPVKRSNVFKYIQYFNIAWYVKEMAPK